MNNMWIVIQGPMKHYRLMKKFLNGYKNVVWSTWKNDQETIKEESHISAVNLPASPGVGNINLQLITTLNGIEIAEKNGAEHIIKLRSDIVPTNFENFLGLFDKTKLNFLCAHNNEKKPYFIDYFFSGPTADLKQLISDTLDINSFDSFKSFYGREFAEARLTSSVKRITSTSILEKVCLILHQLNEKNDLYWIKQNCYLSSYKNHSCYQITLPELNDYIDRFQRNIRK